MKVSIVMAFLFLIGCRSSNNSNITVSDVCSGRMPSPTPKFYRIEDLKNSSIENRSLVTTEGYMYLNMEDVAIYPDNSGRSLEDAYWLNFSDSLNKRFADLKNLSAKKVVLTGYLNGKAKGHLNSYSGEIDSVFCVKLSEN